MEEERKARQSDEDYDGDEDGNVDDDGEADILVESIVNDGAAVCKLVDLLIVGPKEEDDKHVKEGERVVVVVAVVAVAVG